MYVSRVTDIQEHYQNYYRGGGLYRLSDYRMSSRYLMITNWLKAHVSTGGWVADIGCGDGTYSKDLTDYVWTNLDINDEVEAPNKVVWDLEKTPYPIVRDQEAVVCSEVLEHLFSPEKVHAEAYRVLKPGGKYIISTPNFDWIEHHLAAFRQVVYDESQTHAKEHIRFYTLDTHVRMLDKTGFKVLEVMGADLQFGSFFHEAATVLLKELPEKNLGEVHYLLGKMFSRWSHTIGILAEKIK